MANKKQRLSLVDALASGDPKPSKQALAKSDSAFNYSLIKDVGARGFLQEQAVEIKNLLVDSLRLHQKAEEILDQSTRSLVEAGRSFQAAKARLGRGPWGEWLRDEFSETFIQIGVVTQTDTLDPQTIERKVQELMQFARTIDTEPEHQDLMKLSNVKPYLLARLTAPSTPPAARSELVAQIQKAEASKTPLPSAKAVREVVKKYNPKPSEVQRSMPRSLPSAPADRPVEIVAVIPASTTTTIEAPDRATETTVETEAAIVSQVKVKPRHLYLCGKHVIFSGSPADPQWLASLPRSTDSDGNALFDLLTDYSESSEPVVLQIGGQVFAACENLSLLAEIISEWTSITGKEAIEQPPRR